MKFRKRSTNGEMQRRCAEALKLPCLLSIALAGGAQAARAPAQAWSTLLNGTASPIGTARTLFDYGY